MANATFVRGATQENETENTFRGLVGSLDLPPEMAARIREIISRSVVARDALPSQISERRPAPEGDGTMIPGLWSRTMLLLAERNAAIQALLTDPEQQRVFEVNAFAEMQQLFAMRPHWAN